MVASAVVVVWAWVVPLGKLLLPLPPEVVVLVVVLEWLDLVDSRVRRVTELDNHRLDFLLATSGIAMIVVSTTFLARVRGRTVGVSVIRRFVLGCVEIVVPSASCIVKSASSVSCPDRQLRWIRNGMESWFRWRCVSVGVS